MTSVENFVKKIYEARGCDVIKKGIPDLIILKDGNIKFIEIKSHFGYFKEEQINAFKLLRKHGFNVEVECWSQYDVEPPKYEYVPEMNKVFEAKINARPPQSTM